MKKTIIIIFLILFFTSLFFVLNNDKFNVEYNFNNDVENSYTYSNFIKKEELVVINLWASWCKPCLEEIPLLNNLKKKYPTEINFISFSYDKDTLKAIEAHTKNNFSWEETSVVDYKYKKSLKDFFNDNKTIIIDELPRTIVLKNGKILKRFDGKVNLIEIIKFIDENK
ncbi:TlpA disulfide reductase family protein [Flavobacterium sp.]|uniref:TlpA family protein disulfide reductase n=1 Tax=Flavobacterium sp. TaxID=239 RepID=UPI00263992E4|nr:TlpA disulfide reductase family protein [Flavobacterium sp.]MDD2984905.1 TlpA disulfide reductase family protein [Flavobacterium sp.]